MELLFWRRSLSPPESLPEMPPTKFPKQLSVYGPTLGMVWTNQILKKASEPCVLGAEDSCFLLIISLPACASLRFLKLHDLWAGFLCPL